jgi:hypothetical protein
MRWFALLFTAVFLFSACDAAEKAVEAGNEVVDTCADLAKEDLCPVGTTVSFDAGAVAECGGTVGGTVDLTSQSAEVAARCGSSGECSFLCVPPSCCGGEEWTDTSYKCELPCAAACSCDGKCGTVTGVNCEAICGGCGGIEVCLNNVCSVDCGEGIAECGGDCCENAASTCHNNVCCDPVENCKGVECGGDGCGGECEDQDSIAGCDPGQACDNGTCIADCSGSLDVCDNAVGSEYVKTCAVEDGVGKWTQEKDCNFEGKFCMNTSTGAVCAECTSNDPDEEGGHVCDEGYCLTTPTGAQCVSCLDNSHCQVAPKLNEDGLPLNTCVGGQCSICMDGPKPEECCATESGLPECTNDDETPRNCGDDGCGTGTFCKNQDYTCNGVGACNEEDGSCEDLADCTFEYQDGEDGDWQQVSIPHGFPMCNSIHPELDSWGLDPGLAAEAVISGSVDMGDPDEIGQEPFDNVCAWKIHEFEVGEEDEKTTETLNCSATDQVCFLTALDAGEAGAPVNPFALFASTLTYEDFECLDKSECADFGLEEEAPFCNVPDSPAYQESMEEGSLVKCVQNGEIAKFECEACDNEGNSECLQEGWGCFTSPWIGGGECGPDGCGPEIPDGTEVGSCQEIQASSCETEFESWCTTIDDGDEWTEDPPAVEVCTYDPVTNESTSAPEACADGWICVNFYSDCNPNDPDDCNTKWMQAACQEPLACPEVPGMDTPNECGVDNPDGAWACTYCNQEGEPWYQEGEGPGVVGCLLNPETNELGFSFQDDGCQGDEQCFPGGEPMDPNDPGVWKNAICENPQEPCPAATWCANNQIHTCQVDPLTNWKTETDDATASSCVEEWSPGDVGVVEACYVVNQETGEALWNQNQDPIYPPDDGWEPQCLNKVCGPAGNDFATACYDPATECVDVSEGDAQQAFEAALTCGEFIGPDQCTDGTLPTYACLPTEGSCEELALKHGLKHWAPGDGDVYICNNGAPFSAQTWNSSYVVRCTNTADGPTFDLSDGDILWSNGEAIYDGCSDCHEDNPFQPNPVASCACSIDWELPGCDDLSVCGTYCVAQEQNCTGGNAINFGAGETCESVCDTWPEGEPGDVSNDSAYCRLYHVTVAAGDPQTHCPHAGPDGGDVCVGDGA